MTNKDIYKKTLVFSIRRLIFDVLSFLLLGAVCALGFFIMERINGMGLIGLAVGLVLGIVVLAIVFRYIGYTYKAGQIAMMTVGVTENQLPENVLAEGKKKVKERFLTVAAFYAVTRVIKGIFNQLSRGISSVGRAIGGDSGGAIGDAIGIGIQVMVSYLSDCCLGWVFFRSNQNSAKATCEGAVLFFKKGKTLFKNLGRIFGMGIASLLVIGGAFFGIFYLICKSFPTVFDVLVRELGEFFVSIESTLPEALSSPQNLMLIVAGIAALIIWDIIHSTFIRPFVLVGVLRNYLESGMNDIPTEDSFRILDEKSPKFRKLREQF